MKPNIFEIATKELSQDGFFTWLIRWGDEENKKINQDLSETARDFLKYLISLQYTNTDIDISKVEAFRQWQKIDISVKVNDEYFIIIEDKTNSKEHSDQLEQYKKKANEKYASKGFKFVYIYLKTGNESLVSLMEVEKKLYSIVSRKDILNILNKRVINNEIIKDYIEYITSIEKMTNSHSEYMTNWYAGEGFFVMLQKTLFEKYNQTTDWGYVPNRTGGFLGLWYYEVSFKTYVLYIQIENSIGIDIKLTIRIGQWNKKISLLYSVFSELKQIASKENISISKPSRFKVGETSTLALVNNVFEKNQPFDLEKVIEALKKIEKILTTLKLNEKADGSILN